MAKILFINGPNLNLLGTREPHIYGSTTLEDVNKELIKDAESLGHTLECFQSNAEADLLERIHTAKSKNIVFIIINPGGLTHTSVVLRDALLGVEIPFIEVHLSNIFARESFRHHSYLSDIATGMICGLGIQGYKLAILAADHALSKIH